MPPRPRVSPSSSPLARASHRARRPRARHGGRHRRAWRRRRARARTRRSFETHTSRMDIARVVDTTICSVDNTPFRRSIDDNSMEYAPSVRDKNRAVSRRAPPARAPHTTSPRRSLRRRCVDRGDGSRARRDRSIARGRRRARARARGRDVGDLARAAGSSLDRARARRPWTARAWNDDDARTLD